MSDSSIALLILGGVIILFIVNRLPVGLVALSVPVALWATDLLELEEAFSGFGDPVIVFIASLFDVSDGIDHAAAECAKGGGAAGVVPRIDPAAEHGRQVLQARVKSDQRRRAQLLDGLGQSIGEVLHRAVAP